MSPADHNLTRIVGTYEACDECHAPSCDPVPPRFPLTVRGRGALTRIVPHIPACPYLRRLAEGFDA